jgi:hypothetical protein
MADEKRVRVSAFLANRSKPVNPNKASRPVSHPKIKPNQSE